MLGFGSRKLCDVFLERNFLHAPTCACVPRSGDVVCNLDQPVVRLFDLEPTLVGAVRIQKRCLRDVFGVGRITEQRKRVVVHVLDVTPVQRLEGLISS